MTREEETTEFFGINFLDTSLFDGLAYKIYPSKTKENRLGIDMEWIYENCVLSIDAKAQTSYRGCSRPSFSQELSQNILDMRLNITYQDKGSFLQNKNVDPFGCKINDYYLLIWIPKLANGKSDDELRAIEKAKRNGEPHKEPYEITKDDYLQIETMLISVKELEKRLREVGVPIEKLYDMAIQCRDEVIAEGNLKETITYFSLKDKFGIKLKENYNFNITVSKIPVYDKDKSGKKIQIGWSFPVNLILPKRFYFTIPGVKHNIINKI